MDTNIFNYSNMKSNLSGLEGEQTSYEFKKDERLWSIDQKQGSARVRFLPYFDGQRSHPYVVLLEIGAERIGEDGKRKWFIEKSLKSIGLACPIDEAIIYLRNEQAKGNKLAKEILEQNKFSLRKRFYSNVFIRQDTQNGTSANQVKIFAYGVNLKNKLESFAMPSQEQQSMGITPKNVFNPMSDGYDVILVKELNPANNIPNWDKSGVVDNPTPLSAKINSVEDYLNLCREGSIHDITKLKDISEFRTYEQIQNKLLKWYPGIVERTIGGQGFLQPTSAQPMNINDTPFDNGVVVNANTGTAEAVNSNWLD